MIRACIFSNHIYGFDVTNYENLDAENDYYSNLLTEDLIERVSQGDIVIYFNDNEDAIEWCKDNEYEYELVESDDNN
jgi:hypothetical protein